MKEYIGQQYGKEDLPFDMISYEYIDGLNTFMQTAHDCKNNGAVNLLCCLKNFILYAIRNEWIEKNPFRYYKMKIDKTNVKVPLTKAELDLLMTKRMPNERLERVRDVWCFSAPRRDLHLPMRNTCGRNISLRTRTARNGFANPVKRPLL